MTKMQQVEFERQDGTRRTGWVEREKSMKLRQCVRFVGEQDWWSVVTVYPFQSARDNLHRVYTLKGYWAR